MKKSGLLLPLEEYKLTEVSKQRFAAEATLGIVAESHPVLSEVAASVKPEEIVSERIAAVIGRLFTAARGQRHKGKSGKSRRTLVGLAAPQIGEPLRIVLIDTQISADRKRPGKLECFINPEIVWQSRETEEGREGCFSTGPVWGLVRRPVAVKIRALNASGKPIERIFEGFTARIAQHEIDHLNGIRFPDRITSDKKRHWVHAEELESYAKHARQWPRTCTSAQWNDLRLGKKEH